MQKDYKSDTWREFNEVVRNRNLWIFGAPGAERILRELEKFGKPWKVAGIVDNDQKKWRRGKTISVSDPNVLRDENAEETVVLICGMHTGEIGRQLEEMGIKNYYSEFWMSSEIKDFYKMETNADKIKSVKHILADQRSRDVLDAIVEKRKTGFMDYTDIKEWSESEYFLDEFWKPVEDGREVFIDGGGYTGDTIEEFINWTKGNYQRVCSFEPQKDKSRIIEEKLWQWGDKVRFFNKGLWSLETRLSFKDGDDMYSGKIVNTENEENPIETVTLDEIVKEKVTFLKMDIEGAEVEAIKGARNIIQSDKPRMAVCIYHKPNDLWEIPLMIHEMVPEYKMYIRHMGIRCYGTILYAAL